MSTYRPYHHGNLRAALLESTRTVLAQVGLEGLSLREVSRHAGVSPAAAYRHFRDKASLLRAVADAAFDNLAAAMVQARRGAPNPREGLERMGVAYVLFAYKNPTDFKIMFRPELCAPTDNPADPVHGSDAVTNEAYQLLVEAIADCQRSGIGSQRPRNTCVLAAWAMVHGLASLITDGPSRDIAATLAAAESVARACAEILVAGLSSVEPPSPIDRATS